MELEGTVLPVRGVTLLQVRGESTGPITSMWQNQNDTSVQGMQEEQRATIPSHPRIPLRIPHHGTSREKRKEQSRGRSRSKVCKTLESVPQNVVIERTNIDVPRECLRTVGE